MRCVNHQANTDVHRVVVIVGVEEDEVSGLQVGLADTRSISKADLQPGDLVFFYSDYHHDPMYVGVGLMVHAPHPGDLVRMRGIATYAISPTPYRRCAQPHAR